MALLAGGGDDLHLEITIRDGMDTQAVYVGLGILLFVYALIITEVVHRTLAAALGGLLAVIALNFYSNQDTLSLKAVTTMIDWETIGLLLGMMVMVGVISHTGVFEWFAVQAYKKSGGEIWTLVVILCAVTAVLSAFLDNVTTMLLLTPVTIQIAKVLDLKPIPILISEVLFSNIGGAATMIGDPPNIMIGSAMSPSAIEGNKDQTLPLSPQMVLHSTTSSSKWRQEYCSQLFLHSCSSVGSTRTSLADVEIVTSPNLNANTPSRT